MSFDDLYFGSGLVALASIPIGILFIAVFVAMGFEAVATLVLLLILGLIAIFTVFTAIRLWKDYRKT